MPALNSDDSRGFRVLLRALAVSADTLRQGGRQGGLAAGLLRLPDAHELIDRLSGTSKADLTDTWCSVQRGQAYLNGMNIPLLGVADKGHTRATTEAAATFADGSALHACSALPDR